MASTELNPSRYPNAATALASSMDYGTFLNVYQEINGEDADLSYLCLAMAAGELAIGLTAASRSDSGAAPSLHSRLPRGELAPEKLFDYLTDAERANLQRATTIVELIRMSFTSQMNEERRRNDG